MYRVNSDPKIQKMFNINYCTLIVLSWKSMDGFGGMQSMNLLKLHADIWVCTMGTFPGSGFHNTHLILKESNPLPSCHQS